MKIPYIITRVSIVESGPHGGSATVFLQRHGFQEQAIHMEPEEGRALLPYVFPDANVWDATHGDGKPPAVMLSIELLKE